jgi:hypothetical protein
MFILKAFQRRLRENCIHFGPQYGGIVHFWAGESIGRWTDFSPIAIIVTGNLMGLFASIMLGMNH